MKFTLPNHQLHMANLTLLTFQVNFILWAAQMLFKLPQVLKKKLAAQCLKFIPWSPKKFLSFLFFSLWGGGCGRGLQLATYPLT
jgi:hypothetical protein